MQIVADNIDSLNKLKIYKDDSYIHVQDESNYYSREGWDYNYGKQYEVLDNEISLNFK